MHPAPADTTLQGGVGAEPDSTRHDGVNLRDTFRTMHPDVRKVGTYHDFEGGRGGEKVDAILASSEWRVLGAAIVRTSRQGRYPSDHFPVTATVALGGR